MATENTLKLRDIVPHLRVHLPMSRSYRVAMRAKSSPMNACKTPPAARRATRRAANRAARVSRKANR
jgi:hypothetical protein